MHIVTVASILCLLGLSLAEDEGAHCRKEGAVKITQECEHVYVCTPHDDTLVWVSFLCPHGSKPDPTGTKCEPDQCPKTFKPTGELNTTPNPKDYDCEANVPKENDWAMIEDPDDCSRYYFCQQNPNDKSWTVEHNHCAPEWHFYPFVRNCLYGPCPRDVLPPPPPPGTKFSCINYLSPKGYAGYVTDPDNCEKYYYCYYDWTHIETVYPRDCEKGKHWSDVTAGCLAGPCPNETLIVSDPNETLPGSDANETLLVSDSK